MSTAVAACAAVLTVLTASGLHELQLRLERWDYDRHLED
ncbi:hypothetical protein C1Y40_04601 [Mycobacterium talmoniae]|uniref:Uncharacterized protein n=1 Tax=Mycobacterium talmoniae TaxID=1858794 RepID=A0A2S8BF15_9MYCO|nr:hypothetical protein C1Y40_04601 [Mycobacterium talmoniae]